MEKKRVLLILFVIFLTLSIGYTVYIEVATRTNLVVNTNVETVVTTPTETITNEEDPIQTGLSLELNKAKLVDFQFLNRDLPVKWQSKQVKFKYTYLGEYSSNTLTQLNQLLKGEYNWRNELDSNGNIILSAPIILKDGVYQVFPHNSLYLTTKYYLFGDLLDWLRYKGTLEGTEMKIGNVSLKCIWVKDTETEKDSSAPIADLIISTCMERNGDRRLLSGWEVITTQ